MSAVVVVVVVVVRAGISLFPPQSAKPHTALVSFAVESFARRFRTERRALLKLACLCARQLD